MSSASILPTMKLIVCICLFSSTDTWTLLLKVMRYVEQTKVDRFLFCSFHLKFTLLCFLHFSILMRYKNWKKLLQLLIINIGNVVQKIQIIQFGIIEKDQQHFHHFWDSTFHCLNFWFLIFEWKYVLHIRLTKLKLSTTQKIKPDWPSPGAKRNSFNWNLEIH